MLNKQVYQKKIIHFLRDYKQLNLSKIQSFKHLPLSTDKIVG